MSVYKFLCFSCLFTWDGLIVHRNLRWTKQYSSTYLQDSRFEPASKNSEYKNPMEKFWPRVLGIKTVSSSLIIFQRAKLSTRSVTHFCWCNWRIFWSKNASEISPRESCSCTTMPRAHRALATQKKLAYLGFQCLDHPPYSPDLPPSDYHLFPGLKKKQLKFRHFSSDAEVIAAVETWLDG